MRNSMVKVESVRALSEGDDEDDVKLPNFEDLDSMGNAKKIEVTEPTKVNSGFGGHTAYKVKGFDDKGEFDVVRRYKDFLIFREVLTKRFPGFFIPPIPGKVVKKMNQNVVNERCHLLDRFMDILQKDKYLWSSDEVQLFTRPAQDVKSALSLLPDLNSDQIIQRV